MLAEKHCRYYRDWIKGMTQGIFPHLIGNRSYIFMHMKDCIASFQKDKNIRTLMERFSSLDAACSQDPDVQIWLSNWRTS